MASKTGDEITHKERNLAPVDKHGFIQFAGAGTKE